MTEALVEAGLLRRRREIVIEMTRMRAAARKKTKAPVRKMLAEAEAAMARSRSCSRSDFWSSSSVRREEDW